MVEFSDNIKQVMYELHITSGQANLLDKLDGKRDGSISDSVFNLATMALSDLADGKGVCEEDSPMTKTIKQILQNVYKEDAEIEANMFKEYDEQLKAIGLGGRGIELAALSGNDGRISKEILDVAQKVFTQIQNGQNMFKKGSLEAKIAELYNIEA